MKRWLTSEVFRPVEFPTCLGDWRERPCRPPKEGIRQVCHYPNCSSAKWIFDRAQFITWCKEVRSKDWTLQLKWDTHTQKGTIGIGPNGFAPIMFHFDCSHNTTQKELELITVSHKWLESPTRASVRVVVLLSLSVQSCSKLSVFRDSVLGIWAQFTEWPV